VKDVGPTKKLREFGFVLTWLRALPWIKDKQPRYDKGMDICTVN
jgi:hypothetical protein